MALVKSLDLTLLFAMHNPVHYKVKVSDLDIKFVLCGK